MNDSLFPIWGEEFKLLMCHNADSLRVTVLDKDMWDGQPIGCCEVSCLGLVDGEKVDEWHDLTVGEEGEVQGSIRVGLQFFSKGSLDADNCKILPCYFPSRPSNNVTLYQDADTPQLAIFDGLVDSVGDEYVPPRLWRDVYDTIMAAQRFIYITGWSVSTTISLLRGEEDPNCDLSNIGELLKRRAEDGLRVLVMIWNDKTSGRVLSGAMKTHDEQTEAFFRDSAVQVANVSRVREGGGVGMVESTAVETMYSHHQKCVIADASIPDSNLRRLVAYIGGIDLTNGRYDKPEYPLYDYQSTHGQDFYQGCTPGATASTGPREPWHDVHARVEGPAALDILQNFVDRWSKQVADKTGYLVELSEEEFDLI